MAMVLGPHLDSPPVCDMSRVQLMSTTSENRGCHLYCGINNSIRSCLIKLKLRTSEATGIPILPDTNTRQMPVLVDSSDLFVQAPAHSDISAIEVPHTSVGLEEEFDSTPLYDVSLSSSSIDTMSLAPNLGLFHGSHHEPPYLFEFPAVPPWDELVTALVTETGCEADGIVLSSKVYPDMVDDEPSYQAWLTWSLESDGLCSTDLWLD
ncbi:hypothetical protein JB92DRAFT_3000156 [Gautieria morchelliformis]|nr:hypothetical protein JB92DRAFT_3000156 [Gautieria morchelliformis]